MTEAATILSLVLAYALICGLIGRACGAGRGRGTAGFWLGVLFGPLGWLFALVLPANTYGRRRRYR